METSETVGEIAKALAAVHGEIENAKKNAKNPHFRSDYADLAEIINTATPVLTKHGISIVQSPGMADGLVTVESIMLHTSGEWIKGTAAAPMQKQDPQGVGSAVTYLRRYSLAALCGIAQEDDDGNAASPPRESPRQQSGEEKPKQAGNGPASEKQVVFVKKLANSSKVTDAQRGQIATRIVDGMTKKQASDAIEWLQGIVDGEDDGLAA